MDQIDKAILDALWADSRTTDRKIAETLSITSRTVAKRISRLYSAGLKNMIFVDFHLLGMIDTICIKVRLDKSQHINYEALEQCIRETEEVYFAAFTKGDFDMLLLATTRSMNEYARFIDDLRIKLPYENIVSHIFLNNYVGFIPPTDGLLDMAVLNRKDKAILKQLSNDSRTAFSHVAKTVGVSVPTVISHVEKLKSMIACRSAVVKIDNFRIFFEFVACKYKTDEELDSIILFLQKYGNNVYGISGEYDLLSMRVFSSSRAYYSFLNDMEKTIGRYITRKEDAEATILIKGMLPIHPKSVNLA